VRNNDSVTISGSNGNKAPQSGSKSFSLQDCIARNGGAPPPAGASVQSGQVSIQPTVSPCSADPLLYTGLYALMLQDIVDAFPGISCNQAIYLVTVFAQCWGAPGLVITSAVPIWFARSRRKVGRSKSVNGRSHIDDSNRGSSG